jgi:hypothetical protein
MVKAVIENYDNSDLSYARTKELVTQYPSLKGIYATPYNFVSVCRCLADQGSGHRARSVPGDGAAYAREPAEGKHLSKPVLSKARTAVKVLYEYLTEKKSADDIIIMAELVMKSNLECYKKDYQERGRTRLNLYMHIRRVSHGRSQSPD